MLYFWWCWKKRQRCSRKYFILEIISLFIVYVYGSRVLTHWDVGSLCVCACVCACGWGRGCNISILGCMWYIYIYVCVTLYYLEDSCYWSSDVIYPFKMHVVNLFVALYYLGGKCYWVTDVFHRFMTVWAEKRRIITFCHIRDMPILPLSMMTSSNGNIFRVTSLLCGESLATGEFPSQRPLTRGFDVFFDLRLKKRLSKQSRRQSFETPLGSLWYHCNVVWYFSWI